MAYALQNVRGRRAFVRKSAEGTDIETASGPANDATRSRRFSMRRLVLLSVLSLSAMQYLYADVHLSIYRLPSLVVFASPR